MRSAALQFRNTSSFQNPLFKATRSMYGADFTEVFDQLSLKRGEQVYQEGNTPRGLYYVAEGQLKLCKMGREGKMKITKVANAGEYVGCKELLSHARYKSSAIALQPAVVYFVPKADFFELMETQIDLLQHFLQLLSDEVERAEERMVELAYSPVRERLAGALLQLSETEDEATDINITREELANLVGTATETAIRLLRQLKDDHLIETNGRSIRVLDRKGLRLIIDM